MITPLTRRRFLQSSAAILGAGLASRVAFAEEPPAAAKPAAGAAAPPPMFSGPIETIRLEDDLYVLCGAGGNVGVLFDADHLLVIDSGVPNRGPELLAAADKLAPGVHTKTLFNTHWHFDHTGGNGAFVKGGYTVVGSSACRTRMGQKITMEDVGMSTEPTPEANRPWVTFDDRLKLFDGAGGAVAITKIAPAHTDTDAIAFLEKHNVLHTGDLHFSGIYPVIDRSSGGSLDGMIAASKHLLTLGDDKTRVIPGHGPLGGKSAIKAQLDLLVQVHERLAPLGEKKRPMSEVLAAKPLADLDAKWGHGFLNSMIFTRMAYGQWLTR